MAGHAVCPSDQDLIPFGSCAEFARRFDVASFGRSLERDAQFLLLVFIDALCKQGDLCRYHPGKRTAYLVHMIWYQFKRSLGAPDLLLLSFHAARAIELSLD